MLLNIKPINEQLTLVLDLILFSKPEHYATDIDH